VGASTGTLTANPPTSASYVVGAGDAGTSITFQGVTNALAPCAAQTDQVTYNFLAPITSSVTASPASFCQTGSVSLTGTITNTNTGTWACTNCTGTGTFSPDNSYNNVTLQTSVTFTPSPSDTSAASLTFRLTSDAAHACGSVASTPVTVTLDKKPRVAPMSDMVRCANNNVITLPTPGITHATTGVWHAAATKTTGFTPSNTFPGAVSYDPDTTEVQNGFVTLTFIAIPAGASACPPDSAKFVVTFSDAPVANAGLDRTICKNNPILNLVGTINPGAGFNANWTSPNCGTACFSSPNTLATNYTLSYPADTNGVSSLMLFLTATDPTGLCSPDRDTVVINLTQPPVVDITTTFPGPICNDNPFVNLTGTSTGGYNWSSTGTGTFQVNAFQPNVVYPFTAADRAKAALASPNNIIRIYLSSNNGMCLPVTDSVDITLTPSPVITIAEGDSSTICANINTVALNASVSQAGFNIDWTTTGNGTFSPDAPTTPANSTTYTLTGLDKSAGSIVLTAHTTNPVGSTCLSAAKQFKVNITPLPIVNAGNNVTVCQNVTSIDLSDASFSNAASATWSTTGSGVFGLSNTTVGAGSVYYPTYLLPAGTNDVDQPSVTLTLTAVGCSTGTATKTIFFTPKPTVSAGTDQTVCNEASSVSISGTATNFSSVNWRVQGSASTFANTAAATYNLTAANKAAGFVNLVFTVNGNGTCGPITDTVRINVRPQPTLEIGPNASFCSKTLSEALAYNFPAVTVTNSGISPVVDWTPMANLDATNALSPTYTISATDILAGSVTISARVRSHPSCMAVSDAMTINITQAPTLDLGPNIGICASSGTTIQLNSTFTNAFGTPSWISDSSGIFDNPNIAAPIYDPTATEEAAGNTTTIYATISGLGSCPPATDSVKISFNAIPALADLQDSVICFTSGVPFNYNVSSGIIGDWTTDMGAFLAPGGTGQQSVTLQATAVANGTINITFDPSSPCYAAQTATAVLTLVQAPTVVADGPSDVCVNNLGSLVNITSTAANQGSLQWSIVQGFGTIGSSTAEDATYTTAADSSDFGLSDILVKITANATHPSCPAAVDTFTIRTHQAPVPTVTNQIVCSDIVGDANAVTLDGSVSGTGYTGTTWIINSGVASITSINSLNTTATLSALPASVTLQVNGLHASCSAVDVPLNITPQTAPTFTVASTPFNACSNGASIDLDNANMSPSVSGGMWISTTGGMFTPSVNGATGVEYTPSTTDITAGTVDLIYAITDTGVCYKDYRDTVTVTLNTPITVNTTSPTTTFCAQSNNVSIAATTSITPLPGGSITTWSTPNGLGNFGSTSVLSTTYDPNPLNITNGGDVANGGAVLMIKLDLPVAYGCPDDSDYISLLLVPEPAAIVNAGSTQQICVDRVSAQLQGLILNADGGVWRTTKYGNISDPTLTATGTFSDSTDLETDYFLSATDRTKSAIRLYLYSVGGNALCTQEIDSVDISFTPIPVPSATASAASVCADVDSINLTGAFTAMGIDGIWSSSGDGYFTNVGTFDPTPIYIPGPTDIAAGSVVFTYSSNSFQDCQVYSARDTTLITPKIEVNVGPDQTICGNNTAGITITASSPPTNTGVWSILGTFDVDYAGTFTQINPLQATYSPADSIDPVVGAVTLRFVSSGGTPCKPDSAQMVLRIAPAPMVTIATNTQTVCNDVSSINVNVTSIAVASQGFWTSTGTGAFGDPTALNTTYNFSASDLDSTNITIAFITTDNTSNGSQCNAAADAMVITLKPKPVVTVLPQYNCVTPVGVSLDNSSVTYVDPGSSGIWSTSQPASEGQFSLDKFISTPGSTATSYFPSASDINRGTVTLTLTSTGAGTCQPVSRSVTLNVSNTPIADAGPDLFVCSNSSVSLTATPKTNLVAYDWLELPAGATYSGLQVTAPMTATNTNFELTVTDDRGCSNRDTVTVNAVADPLIDQTAQQCYDFFGYINVSIGGTTSPLGGYQWYYNGSLMSSENRDSVRVTQPGSYQVFYTLGACTQSSDEATLILDLPRVLTPDVIGCKNDTVTATVQEIPNDQLGASGINEMPFESYVWTADPDQPVTVPNGNPGILPTSTQNLNAVDTLTYLVNVSYTTSLAVTCSYLDSVRVISIPTPDPNIVDSTQVCAGTVVTLDANTPPSNLPQLAQFPQLIEWYVSGTPATIIGNDAVYSPTTSNDYVVQVTIGQCVGDDSARVDFRPFPAKTLGEDIKQCFEQVGSVTLDAGAAASAPGLTGVTYQWTSGDGDPALTTSTSQTTVITYAQIKDLEDENILAMVTTTNQFGPLLSCPTTDTILVRDVCVPRVFPPTVFHPGDGNPIDAEFTIKSKYINPDKFKLTVYSRWGEVIFYSEDVNKHWDGTYRGDLMPIGVYAYIITYEGKDELNKGPFRKEGRIVLVR
jgi:gliding motility-associated-like protein